MCRALCQGPVWEGVPGFLAAKGQVGAQGHGGPCMRGVEGNLHKYLGCFAHLSCGVYVKKETGSFVCVCLMRGVSRYHSTILNIWYKKTNTNIFSISHSHVNVKSSLIIDQSRSRLQAFPVGCKMTGFAQT